MTNAESINNAKSINNDESINNNESINNADSTKKVVIKEGALFSISSRAGGNNDLTLDESVHVKLYKNAVVNISGTSYIYGPIGLNNPNPNPINNVIVLEKGSKYHVNNVNIDPIGLTTTFDIEQKVCMNPVTPIILPYGTVLHTLDNIMEFTLTKAVHCTLA
jgi:hypothetical protein